MVLWERSKGSKAVLLARLAKDRKGFQAVLASGFLLAVTSAAYNLGMTYIPVSFLNTIKSTIPLWTCLISTLYFGNRYSVKKYFSLIPVVGGTALASLNEIGFNTVGFGFACSSALATTLYNFTIKKTLDTVKEHSRNLIQLYICFVSFISLFPLWILTTGLKSDFFARFIQLWRNLDSSSSDSSKEILGALMTMLVIFFSGVNYFVELFLSASAIHEFGPLGYSIVDVIRRLVVICASIIMFGNAVSSLNAVGIFITMTGVLMYNMSDDGINSKKISSTAEIQPPKSNKPSRY